MLLPKPRLHQLAQETIATLAKDGIVCTPDEILWLQEMAGRIMARAPSDSGVWLDYPTLCGNCALWPLSIGAKLWFRSTASEWFGDSFGLHTLALGYAMAHSRDPARLLELKSRVGAAWVILCWARGLTCSLSELALAIESMTPKDSIDIPSPKEEADAKSGRIRPAKKNDWGETLALLMHIYPGHDLKYWLWELSDEAVAALYEHAIELSSIARGQPMTRDKRVSRATAEFRLVVKYIRQTRESAKRQDIEGGGKVPQNQGPDQAAMQHPKRQGGNEKQNSPGSVTAQELPGAGDNQGSQERNAAVRPPVANNRT